LDLTPEEKHRIYEEEKARLETEAKTGQASNGDATGLPYNIASFLCYLGMWVSGIVFLVIEQKDSRIRFHAAQSIVTFSILLMLGTMLHFVPVVGWFFAASVGIAIFILWIVLMVKAYCGELYRLPVAADLAELLLKAIKDATAKNTIARVAVQEVPPKVRPEPSGHRAGKIVESVFAIIFGLVMLVIINFYHEYIAYYSKLDGVWIRQPLLTGEWYNWLPIANTVIVLSAIGHVFLIIYGQRFVQESIRAVIDVLTIIAIVSLFIVFPFDFYPLPFSEELASFVLQTGMVISMVVLAVMVVVRFIRLIIVMLRT